MWKVGWMERENIESITITTPSFGRRQRQESTQMPNLSALDTSVREEMNGNASHWGLLEITSGEDLAEECDRA